MSLDQELTYLTRIQHLSDLHSQSKFWSHDLSSSRSDIEVDPLLCEIGVLLSAIPNIDQQIITNLLERCNPYNYSLIRILLNKSATTDAAAASDGATNKVIMTIFNIISLMFGHVLMHCAMYRFLSERLNH